MKSTSTLILALATLLPAAAQVDADFEINKQGGFAEAEADIDTWVEANGDQTHVERKSVTITSENGRTVRKTTTFKNGKEHTKTEILDNKGNVIDVEGDDDAPDNQDPEQTEEEAGPWLGVRVEEASPALRDQLGLGEGQGVVVNATAPDGPAAKSGLRENDILLKLDETALGTPEDLREALDGHQPGEQVSLTYLRRGKEERANVTLEEEPGNNRRGNPGDGDDAGARAGDMKIEIGGNGRNQLEAMIADPNIPDELKKTLLDMLKGLDLDGKAGGGNAPADGEMKIEIRRNGAGGLDAMLDNPNLPDDFKKTVRRMLDRVLGDDDQPDGEGDDL